MKFGKWRVIYCTKNKRGSSFLWLCQCECGIERLISTSELHNTKSCGCYRNYVSSQRYIRHQIIDLIEVKRCSKCREWLSLEKFSNDKNKWDNLASWCKKCARNRKQTPEFLKYQRDYENKKVRENLELRIRKNLRARMYYALKSNRKSASVIEFLGCSMEQFKHYLGAQLDASMTWENYGSYWHIDHIRPCVSFNLQNLDEQKICFHYSNMRPLSAIENIKKGGSW